MGDCNIRKQTKQKHNILKNRDMYSCKSTEIPIQRILMLVIS